MSMTLTAAFATRREAEMAVERLVQEYSIERTDIFLASDSDENTVGEHTAGADAEAGQAPSEGRADPPLHGPVTVSVDIEHDALATRVRSAFREFDAKSVDQD